MVTDNWCALGDPDSTGTNGDYQDFTITVLPVLSFCDPIFEIDPNFVMLHIQENTMLLPLYYRTEGDFPGMVPEDGSEPGEYYAYLGNVKSNICGPQGFDDRLYCTFNLTSAMLGTAVVLNLYKMDCDDPVHTAKILIPELAQKPKAKCSENLGLEDCKAAGGTYVDSVTRSPSCDCP